MTRKDKDRYEETNALRKVLADLKGRKFRLDCGHYVSCWHFLGNDITIRNGKHPEIICSQCGY